MGNIIEFSESKNKGIFVEVPDGSANHFEYMGYLQFKMRNPKCSVHVNDMFPPDKLQKALDKISDVPEWIDGQPIKLPEGEWKPIGMAHHLTSSDKELICANNGMGCYDNHLGIPDNVYTIEDADHSFAALQVVCDVNPYDTRYLVLLRK